MLSAKLFDTRIKSEKVENKEKWLGYFIGPISVILMNSILSNYLNVYYTDVLDISGIWGGLFISAFPIVAKTLDVLTFIYMGIIVDRTRSRQGKARPWILFSAPLLTICMILLFVVPKGNDNLTAIWIFVSYTVFYAVAYTMYSTAHTLMVPLSTHSEDERSKLSLITNTPNMVAGSLIAILFPCIVVPLIGVNRRLWVSVMLGVAAAALPMILLEYFFTRERVTEQSIMQEETESEKISLREQFSCCLKSRQWVILMIYLILIQTVNAMFSASTFYYCNWVLGSYNDGYTQALFYALGQAPLGIGIVLCRPVCNKLGKGKAMVGGFVLAFVGVLICLINPGNLVLVLTGQVVRTIGLIPSTFMISSMLGDALDEVEQVSGRRCDGFSSSVMNCITTLMGGIALCIFNFGISRLGYQAPTETFIPVQNGAVQNFIIFCVIGVQAAAYPVIALLQLVSIKKN
ncbi:MAG: MFS transporter [Lachnospiraceae bacterium]|nr:MFS transporter [Lachnospiraceae bacterium]